MKIRGLLSEFPRGRGTIQGSPRWAIFLEENGGIQVGGTIFLEENGGIQIDWAILLEENEGIQIDGAILLEENKGIQIGGAISLGFCVVNRLLARVWCRESAFRSGLAS